MPGSRSEREDGQPAREREEPLPSSACGKPGGLVPLGRGGLPEGTGRGKAGLPFHRICHLPLVSRDGTRVVRRRGGRPGPQGVLCFDQGGPGRAAGCGQGLHDRVPGHDKGRGLAPDHLHDPRRKALLCRHLLPEGEPDGDDRLRGPPEEDLRTLDPGSAPIRAGGRADHRGSSTAIGGGRNRVRP